MTRALNTPHYDKLIVQEVAPRDGLQIEPTGRHARQDRADQCVVYRWFYTHRGRLVRLAESDPCPA